MTMAERGVAPENSEKSGGKAEGRAKEGKGEGKKEPEGEEVAAFTVPLGGVWKESRWRRTPKAVRTFKEFALRHLKVEPESLKVSQALNELLWSWGIERPPRRVRVRVLRDKEGVHTIYPAEH